MTTATTDTGQTYSKLAWLIAGCCAGAGLIHLTVIAEHSGGDVIVPVGFAITGVAQLALAAALITGRASRTTAILAIAVNLGATAVWAWSRTAGLPFDPYNGVAEEVSSVDLTCVILQAVAITLAVGLLIAPDRFRLPSLAAAIGAVAAVAIATVVVVTPESSTTTTTVAGAAGAPAASAGGDGHGHSHGGAAKATPAAGSNDAHASEMLAIDRARCDLGFNPKAYWQETRAMNVDTYDGGSMAMATIGAAADVARQDPLNGKGSARLDELLAHTSQSSAEVSAAQMIAALAEIDDDEYEAWRRWVVANPGNHGATPTDPTAAQPKTMGHAGPNAWKAMVDPVQCDQLGKELRQARKVSERYATGAAAKADGYRPITPYLPGIAAHYMKFSIVDGTFDIDNPEMLLFDGSGDDAKIVGLSYFIRQPGEAEPTQGFVGDNDHYHRHFGLCVGAGGVIGDSATSEEECKAMGGRKSGGSSGWMSHAWIVPGCESPWGVFSGENPVLDAHVGQATGKPGSEGCAKSKAAKRYDQSPGESDLSSGGVADEASGP